MEAIKSHSPKKLKQLAATAICGNDITSSCLYVSALTIAYAGQYAFISLIIVGIILFFFRKIYGEVVGALQPNEGAYDVLLNTTSKSRASLYLQSFYWFRCCRDIPDEPFDKIING